MTTNALLWVSRPATMLQRVGGLTVVERQLFTLARAGLTKVWVSARRPDEKALASLRLPPGLELFWAQRESDAKRECEPPYLLVSGAHFIRVETLRYVAQAPYPAAVALEDTAGMPVVQVFPMRSDDAPIAAKQPLPEGSTVALDGSLPPDAALPWLLAAGTKSQDGFMARHFDRHISLAVSRLLLDTPVTPNMMTVLSSSIGLAGAACFVEPTHRARLAGALLVWLHSVLDGCDGELARIRFQESPLGADIDFWGDNLVHMALFGCMAYGFFKADQSALPVLLGAAACLGTLGSASLAYLRRVKRRRDPRAEAEGAAPGLTGALSRIENILAARDFIYLLVFLAYIDRTYEFLWASAVGSLLFLAMMLKLRRPNHEQAEQSDRSREGQAGSPAPRDGSSHQHLYSGR